MVIKLRMTNEQVEAEFLRAEWYKSAYDGVRNQFNNVVLTPNFNNSQENAIRKSFLWQLRRPLLDKLPNDIEWYVAGIDTEEFSRMMRIRENGWDATFGSNKTLADCSRAFLSGDLADHGVNFEVVNNIKSAIGSHEFKEKIICISLMNSEPFTVIEGNHRALAFQIKREEANAIDHIPQEIILGTSPNMGQAWWLNSL